MLVGEVPEAILEMEGTYPLPEAQLDRFFFKLVVPYPSADDLSEILRRTTTNLEPVAHRVADGPTIEAMGQLARDVPVAAHVMDFVVRLTMATHPHNAGASASIRDYVQVGVSPRGAQAIVLGAKIRALFEDRPNASIEDVLYVAKPALRHRLILNFNAVADRVQADEIVDRLLETVPESAVV